MSETPLRERWTLEPGVRFLNHGSYGACPRDVLAAQAGHRAAMEAEPVRYLGREIVGRLADARARLAAFVGAETADLVFVPNATTGVNGVLRSFAFEAGDELLVTSHAYNACRNAADFVCARSGARVVVADVPFPLDSPDAVVATVLAGVSSRTRLALIDHVTSETGLVLPIERIAGELAERGVPTLVDGAHAPGMVPLAVPDVGAAFYTGNCHKWICAPKGAAFLWVRRDLQESVRPAVISHGANSRWPDHSRFETEFGWTGTDDPTAYLAVPDAIEAMGSLFPGGWNELRERNRALVLRARALLCEALEIDEPAPESMIGSLASVPLPDGDGRARGAFDVDPLQRELFDAHRIEVPVLSWPAPPARLVRVSAQAYNTIDEYRALAQALRSVFGNVRTA